MSKNTPPVTADELTAQARTNIDADRVELKVFAEMIFKDVKDGKVDDPIARVAACETFARLQAELTRGNALLVELAKVKSKNAAPSQLRSNEDSESLYDAIEQEPASA